MVIQVHVCHVMTSWGSWFFGQCSGEQILYLLFWLIQTCWWRVTYSFQEISSLYFHVSQRSNLVLCLLCACSSRTDAQANGVMYVVSDYFISRFNVFWSLDWSATVHPVIGFHRIEIFLLRCVQCSLYYIKHCEAKPRSETWNKLHVISSNHIQLLQMLCFVVVWLTCAELVIGFPMHSAKHFSWFFFARNVLGLVRQRCEDLDNNFQLICCLGAFFQFSPVRNLVSKVWRLRGPAWHISDRKVENCVTLWPARTSKIKQGSQERQSRTF